MADILSLSKVRKAKARSDKEQHAVENRARFGRTKAEKARDAAEAERVRKRTESHRRES